MTDKVRLAVIGVGTIGTAHVRDIPRTENAVLAAVCDIDAARARSAGEAAGVPFYTDYRQMLEKERIGGVIVATPHYDHTPISIHAMQRGTSVLVEKPEAVHVRDARRMNEAYQQAKARHPGLIYSIMLMTRTQGPYARLKAMIDAGDLGRLIRTTWIVTDWFRTQAYYDNGDWRATWSGEGGGVLLNQCPHNLDVYQWLVGLPARVTGFAAIGKYHDIEVEDEVTGFFEHENGMVGHFVTTTAESPGTNRLEIVGENGKVVWEGGKILLARNETSMLQFLRNSPQPFARVPSHVEEVAFKDTGESGHRLVIQNFAAAIQDPSTPLIAHGTEGIRGLSLGNAIMLSSWQGKTVELPLDEECYERLLKERIAASKRTAKGKAGTAAIVDASGSFQR